MKADRYLAKQDRKTGERHLLPCHLLDVVAIVDVACRASPELLRKLARELDVSEASAKSLLLFLIVVHDIGKAGNYQSQDSFRCSDGANGLGLDVSGYLPYSLKDLGHAHLGYVILTHLLDQQILDERLNRDGKYGKPFPESVLRTNNLGTLKDCLRTLFAMTAGHHGTQPRPDLSWANSSNGRCTDADLLAAAELVTFFSKLFQWSGPLPNVARVKRMSYVLNGFITLCDRLGSNSAFTFYDSVKKISARLNLPYSFSSEEIYEAYYKDIALPTAWKVVEEYRPAKLWPIERPEPASIEEILARVAPSGQVYSPTPMQTACDEAFRSTVPEGPFIAVIRDDTGGGKTEVSYLIENRAQSRGDADGIFSALPTMATADTAFARRKRLIDLFLKGKPSVVLSHGRRRLNPSFTTVASREDLIDNDADALEFFSSSAQMALHADIGVGSTDTMLAAPTKSKFSTVRLAGALWKISSFDEVHSYDEYMVCLLEKLLYHQASVGSPVVIMSATLPTRTLTRLLNAYAAGAGWKYESFPPSGSDTKRSTAWLTIRSGSRYCNIPVAGGNPQAKKPVKIRPVHDIREVVNQLVAWAKEGKCAAWYRNTVPDATEAWELLRPVLKAEGLPEPILFHSQFAYADRVEIENLLIKLFGRESTAEDRSGRIVIATQAMEQSLDLDFDEEATDAAILESMIQRFGRRRRHPRTASGDPLPSHQGTVPADERPDSEILLYTAPLENPKSDWYFEQSKGAAKYIYTDHAIVWLACRFLTDPGSIPNRWEEAKGEKGFVPAYDVSPALEAIYPADDVAPPNWVCHDLRALVPASLWPSHLRERKEQEAKRDKAAASCFTFKSGLLYDWNGAQELLSSGENVPTRLGSGWTYVLLERTKDGLHFLRDGLDPLELSSLRFPTRLEPSAKDKLEIEAWKKRLPVKMSKRMDVHTAIVVSPSGKEESGDILLTGECIMVSEVCKPNSTSGTGTTIQRKNVSVTYSKIRGFSVNKR